MTGRYTREGTCASCCGASTTSSSSRGPATKSRLSFDAAALPPLAPGERRTFLLYADGFSKEMDITSASPVHGRAAAVPCMRRYPYGPASERHPVTGLPRIATIHASSRRCCPPVLTAVRTVGSDPCSALRTFGRAVRIRPDCGVSAMTTIRYAAAACQTDLPNPLDRRQMAANTDRMLAMIDAAVAGSAPFLPVRLVVFPEFAHAAPVFPTVRGADRPSGRAGAERAHRSARAKGERARHLHPERIDARARSEMAGRRLQHDLPDRARRASSTSIAR